MRTGGQFLGIATSEALLEELSGGAEIVTAADAGILYEGTPHALPAAIRDALHLDREEIARLVANGRAWLAENCDAKRYGAASALIAWTTCRAGAFADAHLALHHFPE